MKTLLAEQISTDQIDLSFFGASMGGLTLYGIDPELDIRARTYQISEGRFLSNDHTANEIVLVKSYADQEGIGLGDWVSILSPKGAQRFRVVGLITKDGPGQINNGAFGVIPLKTAQNVFDRPGYADQIDIVVSSAYSSSDALESLRLDIQERLGKDYAVIYPASQGRRMAQMLGSYQIGLNFLSGIALFVGAFLIYNAFAMTVVERTREFGMLRTVDMTRFQVTRQVVIEAFVLGVLGSILGMGLGIFLARGLSRLMGIMMNQEMGTIRIDPNVLATSLLVGVTVTVLAALIPAWQAGRISPLEALRIRGAGRDSWLIVHGWSIGLGLLLVSLVILILNPFPYDVQFRLGSLVVFALFGGATLILPASVSLWEQVPRPFMHRIYGNSGRLGSSNVQRAKLRTTLTVAALMIGVAMILIVRGMTESFSGDLKEWINAYIGGDLYVSSSVGLRRDIARRLESVEGVAAVAPIRYLDVKWLKPDGNEQDLSLMAIDPAIHGRVTSFVFQRQSHQSQNGNAISGGG
ncbi:MAG: FtsX-like permease family protein [Anaerolineales bacterium]